MFARVAPKMTLSPRCPCRSASLYGIHHETWQCDFPERTAPHATFQRWVAFRMYSACLGVNSKLVCISNNSIPFRFNPQPIELHPFQIRLYAVFFDFLLHSARSWSFHPSTCAHVQGRGKRARSRYMSVTCDGVFLNFQCLSTSVLSHLFHGD